MPAWLAIDRRTIAFWQQLDVHERRRHRPRRRRAESHRDARADGERQVRPHLGRPRPADAPPDRRRRTPRAPASRAKISRRGTRSASCPAGRASTNIGHELGQPDPPEVECAPVLRVDLPADRHLDRLEADAHPEQGQPPEAEIAHLERGTEASQAIAATRVIRFSLPARIPRALTRPRQTRAIKPRWIPAGEPTSRSPPPPGARARSR